MFQPIKLVLDKKTAIVYLSISFDDGIKIIVTDIYTFSVWFNTTSEVEFFNMTYSINRLSESDLSSTGEIIKNIKSIAESFKPVLQQSVIMEISDDKTVLTLINGNFRYQLPMTILPVTEEIKVVKSIYKNLENYVNTQDNLLLTLDNQINNKNKIMFNIADAYVKRCTYEKESNIFKSNYIGKLFVNRNILNSTESTVNSCIDQLKHSEDSVNFLNPKNEVLWNKIIPTSKPPIETDAKSTPERVIDSQHSITKKTKRNLQGLIRREKKKKIS